MEPFQTVGQSKPFSIDATQDEHGSQLFTKTLDVDVYQKRKDEIKTGVNNNTQLM